MEWKCDLIAGMNQTVGFGTLQVDYWVYVTGLLFLLVQDLLSCALTDLG